jgi:hypothetical protein
MDKNRSVVTECDFGVVQFGTRFGSISMEKDNVRTDWTKKTNRDRADFIRTTEVQLRDSQTYLWTSWGSWGSLLFTDFFL